MSTACALGVFGTQLGTAIGFVLPPFMVKNHENSDLIGDDLYRLSWVLAIYMLPVTAAIIICKYYANKRKRFKNLYSVLFQFFLQNQNYLQVRRN